MFLLISCKLPGLLDCTDWTLFRYFLLGLACRPADSFIAPLLVVFFEGRQSWPGGLVSFVRWLGLFAVFCSFVDGAIGSQCF